MKIKLTLKPSLPALALLAIGSVGLAACGDDDARNQAAGDSRRRSPSRRATPATGRVSRSQSPRPPDS